MLCNNNRIFSSLKNYQDDFFILWCSDGFNPCNSFSAVEFWLSLTWLRLSAFFWRLWGLVQTANIIQAQAVVPFGSKKIYGLGKTAQMLSISSTLLIPDDAANFHNCFRKQSLAGHRLLSAISVKQFPVFVSKSHIFCRVKSIIKLLHVPWRHHSSWFLET